MKKIVILLLALLLGLGQAGCTSEDQYIDNLVVCDGIVYFQDQDKNIYEVSMVSQKVKKLSVEGDLLQTPTGVYLFGEGEILGLQEKSFVNVGSMPKAAKLVDVIGESIYYYTKQESNQGTGDSEDGYVVCRSDREGGVENLYSTEGGMLYRVIYAAGMLYCLEEDGRVVRIDTENNISEEVFDTGMVDVATDGTYVVCRGQNSFWLRESDGMYKMEELEGIDYSDGMFIENGQLYLQASYSADGEEKPKEYGIEIWSLSNPEAEPVKVPCSTEGTGAGISVSAEWVVYGEKRSDHFCILNTVEGTLGQMEYRGVEGDLEYSK